jgi:hypothetical protein
MFARLKYTVGQGGYYYRGLPSWAHGEPYGEENLMKIMGSISLLNPHVDQSVVMSIDDPDVFKFPVAYMVEPGFWTLSDREAESFRAYLQKGGFVIFDDFRGPGGSTGAAVGTTSRTTCSASSPARRSSSSTFRIRSSIASSTSTPRHRAAGLRLGLTRFFGIYEDNNLQNG